jgi:hypothetical protein
MADQSHKQQIADIQRRRNQQAWDQYHQTIQRQRVGQWQRQVNETLQNAKQELADAQQWRDQYVREGGRIGDPEFRERDDYVIEMEQHYKQTIADYQALQPKRQWYEDPRLVAWSQQYKPFFERHGQQANKAVEGALAYQTRARNPDETVQNPAYTGCGKSWEQCMTEEGLRSLEDILEMHGPTYYGVRFDPSEKSLTAEEAHDVITTSQHDVSMDDLKKACNDITREGNWTSQRGGK